MLGLSVGLNAGVNTRRALGVLATGGTVSDITVDGVAYKVHTFSASDDFVVTRGGTVEYLIVAGGGGASAQPGYANPPGGGGGGGVLSGATRCDKGTYAVVVGQGAPKAVGFEQGNDGSPSSLFGLEAVGGGAGGSAMILKGNNGGSGGGSAIDDPNQVGLGIEGQGHNGAIAFRGSPNNIGGGGGGAGEPGHAGAPDELGREEFGVRAHGGDGVQSAINGVPTYYGGGAGGSSPGILFGEGGLGGGATGTTGDQSVGNSGVDGLGGGAAAGLQSSESGSGGDGVVIIRYAA